MKAIRKAKIKSQKAFEHIINEKKVLINDSPFLLHLHFAFQSPNKIYLITDFLAGGDLFFHLSKKIPGGFSISVSRFFCSEIVLALEHLHQSGVIYRDLKLENVLLDKIGWFFFLSLLSSFLPFPDEPYLMPLQGISVWLILAFLRFCRMIWTTLRPSVAVRDTLVVSSFPPFLPLSLLLSLSVVIFAFSSSFHRLGGQLPLSSYNIQYHSASLVSFLSCFPFPLSFSL